MIYSYTAILHGAMAALSLASFIYLFYRKNDANQPEIKAYFNIFLSFFLYNILLITPLILFREPNAVYVIFYLAALFALTFTGGNAVKFSLFFLVSEEKKRRMLINLYFGGAWLAVGLHLIFREIPIISPDGNWVFWYSGTTISYFYILFMFLGGWPFALVMLRGFYGLSSDLLKTRAILLALGGLTLPFAALYYFGAQNVTHIYLAFLFSITGLVLFLIGNIIFGFFRPNPTA